MFNRVLFEAEVKKRGYTIKAVAEIIGRNEATLHRKMSGVSDFTRNEIQLIKAMLNLSSEDVENIFFAKKLA